MLQSFTAQSLSMALRETGSLEITHNRVPVHICSGYLIRNFM